MDETQPAQLTHYVEYPDLDPEEVDEVVGLFEVSACGVVGGSTRFDGTEEACYDVAVWYHNADETGAYDEARADVRAHE